MAHLKVVRVPTLARFFIGSKIINLCTFEVLLLSEAQANLVSVASGSLAVL